MKHPFSDAKQFVAKLGLIEQQINQNQLGEAAQDLNLLAKIAPHDPRIYLLGSRLAEVANNPDGMLRAARKAHQLAPQWPAAAIHLAFVLASRGEAEEAITSATLAINDATTLGSLDSGLLNKAANVAQLLGHYEQALAWLLQSEDMDPSDTSTRYKIGLTLISSGDFAGAVDRLTPLLAQQPNNASILSARMHAFLGGKNLELAIQDGEALLAQDPANADVQFYLAIARGETPKTQPESIILGLFNFSADRFDRHLVVQLKYKLPRDVADMIHAWHPDRKGDVLDLGCGTGLLGACLGPIDGVLVGVDLSDQMIEKAARHKVYDSFHRVNLLDALQATPANLYDVVTALDVLIYVGSLDDVIPNVYRILQSSGRFVFSCEVGADGADDYDLQSTYRYTHQRGYVQRLLDAAGFKEIDMEDRVLRYESDLPVQGFLVTARKVAQVAPKPLPRKRAVI
jgi:predicted TPR repeat methyltransferase